MKLRSDFVERLHSRLQAPLPGIEAHLKLAPALRKRISHIPDNARQSAVLMLIYQHEEHLYVPFMQRAEDGRVHGGQISLPGGKREEADLDFTHTALREAHEELNIVPDTVEVLGPLTEIYIPPSNFMVYPRVAYAPTRPDFVPNPEEVARIIEIPLGDLLATHHPGVFDVDVFGGNRIQAPGYYLQDEHLIWGGTAMIIAEMVEVLRTI